MRAALFSPLNAEDAAIGPLTETAIFSQWFHSEDVLNYARWHDGEVDIVMLGPKQKAVWAVEVKWSDRFCENPGELKSLVAFCQANGLKRSLVTSKTQMLTRQVDGLEIDFRPASVYCYTVGYNLIQGKKMRSLRELPKTEQPTLA
jgi:uncharacterized protein